MVTGQQNPVVLHFWHFPSDEIQRLVGQRMTNDRGGQRLPPMDTGSEPTFEFLEHLAGVGVLSGFTDQRGHHHVLAV